MGIIRTVRGDINPRSIGNSMIHEHIIFDITLPEKRNQSKTIISMNQRWQIDYLSNQDPSNSFQEDITTAADELGYFSSDGGSLIVDQSVFGLNRSPLKLLQISKLSGVHIVAAAGSYTEHYLPQEFLEMDIASLTERFISEVNLGIEGTSVKAGIIGEIGCSWPITAFEKKALFAAASAAYKTGVALSIHPGRSKDACFEILKIIEPTGINPDRIILCHMDRTYPDGNGIRQLLELGINAEWDFFGIEQSYYWMGNVELPNDFARLKQINTFADLGYANQILVSHDICTKTRMRSFGGHGYGHILRNGPELFKRLGIDESLLEQLIKINPRETLAFKGDSI